jgi:hypothetical protein
MSGFDAANLAHQIVPDRMMLSDHVRRQIECITQVDRLLRISEYESPSSIGTTDPSARQTNRMGMLGWTRYLFAAAAVRAKNSTYTVSQKQFWDWQASASLASRTLCTVNVALIYPLQPCQVSRGFTSVVRRDCLRA